MVVKARVKADPISRPSLAQALASAAARYAVGMARPEPWLRGPIDGVHPVLGAVLRSFEMAAEDIARATEGLSVAELWARPGGVASIGFHIRHLAGSIDRLLTYAEGRQLSDEQMEALRAEGEPGASREDLLAELNSALAASGLRVRAFPLHSLTEPRGVGRKHLPSTVAGLLIHTAEHTQRHVGQAVTTALLVSSPPSGEAGPA